MEARFLLVDVDGLDDLQVTVWVRPQVLDAVLVAPEVEEAQFRKDLNLSACGAQVANQPALSASDHQLSHTYS